MQKYKVMHVTFDMRIGGTEMVIKNLVEASDTERFDVSLFCIEEPLGVWGKDLSNNGMLITSVARKAGFDFNVIKSIRKQIRLQQIDVLHCHQYTPWVYGVLASIGLNINIIFTEHGRFYPDYSSPKRRFINPILARMTAHITAISKATKQALVDFEFIQKSRIEVIYNGIKPLMCVSSAQSVRDKYDIPSTTMLLGTVARLDPIKNHFMMLKGMRRCVDLQLDVKLLIVGDGEMRTAIEKSIIELGLEKHVILTGYKPNPVEFLNAIDLYLLTSFSEGTSMTLLEAMSLSKPCIVSDVGGNPEVIEHRVNGIVIPTDDDKALSDSIEDLINNPENMKMMSEASIKRYEMMFSATEMFAQYATLYQSKRV